MTQQLQQRTMLRTPPPPAAAVGKDHWCSHCGDLVEAVTSFRDKLVNGQERMKGTHGSEGEAAGSKDADPCKFTLLVTQLYLTRGSNSS